MKEIAEKANQFAIESQMIADNLHAYNPGREVDRVPLDVIQQDIALMIQWYNQLYTDIGALIRNEKG